MVKNIAIKRISCFLLCLILVFDVTYTKKQESDAFAFVLTPAVIQCVITGLSIAGLVLSSDSFQSAATHFIYNSSDSIKEYFHRVSTGAKYLTDKTVQFTSNVMSYIKDFVRANYQKEGGSLSYYENYVPKIDINAEFVNSEPLNLKISSFDGSNYIDFQNNFFLKLDDNVTNLNFKYFTTSKGNLTGHLARVNLYDSNYKFITSSTEFYIRQNGNYSFLNYNALYSSTNGSRILDDDNNIIGLNIAGQEFIFNEKVDINNLYKDIQATICLRFFSTLISNELEYVFNYNVNSKVYPDSADSLAPSISTGEVLNVPSLSLDESVSDASFDDLFSNSITTTFDPALDIPDIDTVAPPINPPADGIVGWLSDIFDKIISLPQAIASAFESFFDVSEFQLDFSKLKNVGIKDKFPFSIPFDLYNVMKSVLKPPDIDLRIYLDTSFFKIDYVLPVNEPIFQFIRGFFRWSLLFGFIIGLIKGTRDLIKW